MFKRTNKKSSKVLTFCLAMVTFMVVGLVVSSNDLLAQELSEDAKMTAIIQYTLEYRFSKDLKVGDFVKYQLGEKMIELKVTKKEGSGVWIVEEFPGMKIHLLVDLKRMKVLKSLGFDEKGEKHEANPLNDKELAKAVELMKKEMKQQGAYSQFVSWEKGEKREKVDVPAGSFACAYIKPEYSEQHKKQIENYVKQMQKQGKTDAEIDTEISKNEPRIYFNKDVPRLVSAQIAMGWMPWINVFKKVKGGLVESKGMSPLKLIAYSGRAGRVDCGTAKKEKIAKEQPKEKLPVLSEEEMKKLVPEQWPDDWHIFIQRIGNQTIEHCTFSETDDGGLVCVLLLQKGTATKDGVPTQQANLKLYDLLDPSAEEQFTPIDRTDKGPDGTVGLVYKAITFNGHKAQLMKLPGKENTIFITYRSGRFEIRVNNHVVDQGITLDDLKVLCRALKLPK